MNNKKRFEIDHYDRADGRIWIKLVTNNFLPEDLDITEDEFETYLDLKDKLEYPLHTFPEVYHTKITFDEYWEHIPYFDKMEDIYDYLLYSRVGMEKLFDNAFNNILNITKNLSK